LHINMPCFDAERLWRAASCLPGDLNQIAETLIAQSHNKCRVFAGRDDNVLSVSGRNFQTDNPANKGLAGRLSCLTGRALASVLQALARQWRSTEPSASAFEMKAFALRTGTFLQIAKSGKTSIFPHLVPS
jgi:hypothetical protein